jgi:hypothetical protein
VKPAGDWGRKHLLLMDSVAGNSQHFLVRNRDAETYLESDAGDHQLDCGYEEPDGEWR